MLHVQFAVDGQRQLVRQHFNGFQRNGKFPEIILAIGKRYGGLCNALIVRSQHLEEHIGGNIANVLSGVKSEHIALRKRVVEVDVLIVELFGDLANLHATCAKLVVRFDGHGHDGSVLILVGKRHLMDGIIHDVGSRRVLFLRGVFPEREGTCFGNAGIVGGQRRHDLARAVLDLVDNSFQPLFRIGGDSDVAVFGFLGFAARQHLANLFNANLAFCRHVGEGNLCDGVAGDSRAFDLGGDDIRAYGG